MQQQFPFSQAMTANQLGLNPLTTWQNEQPERPSEITVLVRATTTGVRLTAYAGNRLLQERTPVQGGGTAGTTPSPLNTTPFTFLVDAYEKLKLSFDEVAGGTPTIDGLVLIEYIG